MAIPVRVRDREREAVIAYLRGRELVTHVYVEAWRRAQLEGTSGTVTALTYLVDRSHPQYAGRLDEARQLKLVRDGRGQSGANRDYVVNTAQHLRERGVRDRSLERLCDALTGAR